MALTREAVERAMKVQEVIVRGLSGELTWLQVAGILGRSPRSIRRMRWRFEQRGYDGLYDGRRVKPSPKRAPVAEVERILRLYRERYRGFNTRHFYQVARREQAVTLSYTFVKALRQRAGLVAKGRARGRHRRRREPRPCFGELLHLDGSVHPWLALDPTRKQTLIAVVDDATKQLLYGQLVAGGESVVAVMTALRAVLERYGLPMALYTDRARWATYTPTSGTNPDRSKLTQVGRALHRWARFCRDPPSGMTPCSSSSLAMGHRRSILEVSNGTGWRSISSRPMRTRMTCTQARFPWTSSRRSSGELRRSAWWPFWMPAIAAPRADGRSSPRKLGPVR